MTAMSTRGMTLPITTAATLTSACSTQVDGERPAAGAYRSESGAAPEWAATSPRAASGIQGATAAPEWAATDGAVFPRCPNGSTSVVWLVVSTAAAVVASPT